MSDGRETCPYCGKRYKRLATHITMSHPEKNHVSNDGDERKSGSDRLVIEDLSIEELESAIAKKIFDKVPDLSSKDGPRKPNTAGLEEKYGFLKTVEVDFWLTNLHGVEIGIYQKERFMAKNRAFTRNLELVGAIRDEGKPDGMFGYDKDNWDDVSLEDYGHKRLIMKWFNSKSVSHIGTIEEMIVESLSSSIGANDTLPSFKLVIPRYKYIVNLQKEHTKLPKIGEIFTFAMKNQKEDRWEIYSFDEKRFTVGSDWMIKERDGRIVGRIDQKVLNIGGKILVHFLDEELYEDRVFYRVVILFTMMLYFKEKILKKIELFRKLMDETDFDLDIPADEELFYRNPRALKR